MTVTPTSPHLWHGTWPLVAQTDDANPWATGLCWLYCRRQATRVLWVGTVKTPGATGAAYACGPCLTELDHLVRTHSHPRHHTGGHPHPSTTLTVPAHTPAPPPTPPPSAPSALRNTEPTACLHRHTEKHGGKTYCGDCHHQLYL